MITIYSVSLFSSFAFSNLSFSKLLLLKDRFSILNCFFNPLENGTFDIFSRFGFPASTQDVYQISAIKFAATNQQMNVVSGFNKQVIKYSPYIEPTILKLDNDFTGIYNIYTFGVSPYQWTENLYFNSSSFINSGTGQFASYEGLQNNLDKSGYNNVNNILNTKSRFQNSRKI